MTELPTGPLFWRVEMFPTMAEAQAASGPHGLITEAAGKVWLFTLGPQGQGAPRGNKVAEIRPLPTVSATQYLLRVNEGAVLRVALRPFTPIRAQKPIMCLRGR